MSGVSGYGCEMCASSLSPAWSPDRSARPGSRLRVRPACGVRADGSVEYGRFRDVRRLHEDDGAATAACAETVQGHDARVHRGEGLGYSQARKSVVSGKTVTGREDLGRRGIIKNKKNKQ